jgi:hypothetical protein
MTSVENAAGQVGAPPHDAKGPADDAEAGRLPLEGLARWAMRVPWCWPALLTLALGFYQVGQPELWRDRDSRLLGFVPAAVVGLAACLPLAVIGSGQAASQIFWILRPGLSLTVFAFFGRNLFYSTGVAAGLFVLAVLAWAVDRWAAAFATALAVLPVAAVWLVSQGPHAYFFPRYLLFTVGAWAILAGIALSKIDIRVAAAAVLAIAVLAAGDQQVVRAPGAHNWSYYPGEAAVLRQKYRPEPELTWHVRGLTLFLLVRM